MVDITNTTLLGYPIDPLCPEIINDINVNGVTYHLSFDGCKFIRKRDEQGGTVVGPSVTLSSPQAGLYELGQSVGPVQLIATVTQGTNPITNIKFLRGTTEIYSGLQTTYTDNGPFTSPTTWTARVTDGTYTATSNPVSINFVGRFYWGADPNPTLNEAGIEALENSTLKTSFVGTYNFGVELGSYKYFARPTSLGQVSDPTSSFVDNVTNFPIPFQLQGTVQVTNTYGQTLQYYVYRSVNVLGGSFTIKVNP